jgi:hypothetical protein
VTDPAVAWAVLGFADRLRRMGVDLPRSGVHASRSMAALTAEGVVGSWAPCRALDPSDIRRAA